MVAPVGPEALTPWELRNGMWYKREDYHRNGYGVNGAKFRAARHLMVNAILDGAEHIVTAQSVLSPQAAITATLAEELGVKCTVVAGASKPHTAIKHRSIQIAMQAGAQLDTTPKVAYNGVIQPYAAGLAESLGGWQMPYGITTPLAASPAAVEAFLRVGAEQVAGIGDLGLETLVIPFGSGNTTAGVLYGLWHAVGGPERVILVGVGPDRMEWLRARLDYVGLSLKDAPFDLQHLSLHGWFADYSDKMPETVDDIVLHPTYEGKVARFLNSAKPWWWTERNGRTGFWIVGGTF